MSNINYRLIRRFQEKADRVKPEDSGRMDSVKETRRLDLLTEAENAWTKLADFRRERRRTRRYTFGDGSGQWRDLVPDPDRHGHLITEYEYISRQGCTPLQNNMMRKFTKTVLGQFRGNQTEPVCVARDRDEQIIGEMMSIAVQYIYQLNDMWELDGSSLLEMLVSGVVCDRIGYNFIPAIQQENVFVRRVNPARLFYNRVEDVRSFDLKLIGELHDYTMREMISLFADSKADARRIQDLYNSERNDSLLDDPEPNSTRPADDISFFYPSTDKYHRVIEVWKLESKEMLRCHDTAEGKLYWAELGDEQYIRQINAERAVQAVANGIEPMLVDYEWRVRQYWYYRFMTPRGEILKEGESPYWHGQHPYVLRFYNLFDGRPHSFMGDIIDQQRLLNRFITTNDWIINSGAKNLLAIPEGAIPDNYTIDDFAAEWRKVGGVIIYRPLVGGVSGLPTEISHNSTNVGTGEMIKLMMNFLEEITGVHGALQGQNASSGTSGKLYESQANNAANNLIDLLESFKSFRVARDTKIMKTIQQYWNDKLFVNVAGKSYSKAAHYYDPDKVREAEVDLTLSENTATINYRIAMDDYLKWLYETGAISVRNLLSNISAPFADKVLQFKEQEDQEMMQAQAEMQAQGIAPAPDPGGGRQNPRTRQGGR